MNNFVLAATVAAAGFMFAPSQASACTVPAPAQSSDPCEYFDPTGQNPNGTLKLPLTERV